MSWNVIIFESGRHEKVVEEFIKSLDKTTIAKVIHTIDLLEQYGPFLGMPHARKLGQKLSELRIRGKVDIRIIYSFLEKDIYVLHAFKKKTQKTPTKELATALSRLQTLKSN